LAHFEAEGETFLYWIVTADETWVHHFEPDAKGNPWNDTILNLLEEKIRNVSFSRQGHDQSSGTV
jgi:hypothetical protein